MFDLERDYKNAMDKVQFSEDFDKRALQAILSAPHGEKGGRNPMKKMKRIAIGAGSLAAALVIGLLALRANAPFFDTHLEANVAPTGSSVGLLAADEILDETDQDTSIEMGMAKAAIPAPMATSLPANRAADSASGYAYGDSDTESDYEAYDSQAYIAPGEMNTTEYSRIAENGFRDVSTSPLSTFAADVDTASYANVRRMLLEGRTPPADAVRVEEFLNYFHYDYPEPTGDEPFSVTTEIAPCPWNKDAQLLLVGLQAKKVALDDLPKSNLVFLIDVSGSMYTDDKLPLAQKAFMMLTEQLRDGDTISIVTYAGSDSVVLDGVSGKEKRKIADAIEDLSAGGSTAGAQGIQTAYQIAKKHFIPGGNNRVILATDGDLNVGISSEGELTRLIEQQRESGVFLSVLGFGTGNLKDNKLESLADHGNGNYSYIDTQLEAKRALVEQMGANFFTVCKDVKLQLEFNPEMVKSYRQIGYENRQMAAEDFANDEKDGGEIGAGHSVTALYEIVLNDGTQTGQSLKYQTSAATGSSDYLTVSVRAKKPDGDESALYEYPVTQDAAVPELSDNMRFAAAVAEVGMILRDSEFKGTSSYASAAELLAPIQNITQDPYKDEFAYTVRQLSR